MSLERDLRDMLRAVDDEPAPDLMPAIGPRLAARSRRPSTLLVASVALAIATAGVALGLQWTRFSTIGGPGSAASMANGVVPPPPTGDTSALPSQRSSDTNPLVGGALALATKPPGSVGSDALALGQLGGELRAGAACLWLTQDSGRMALLWPFGFSALDDPLRIIGPDGQTLAIVGDDIELGGGSPPVDFVPTAAQDPCGVGTLFDVSVVGTVNGKRVDIGEGSLQLTTRQHGTPPSCPAPPLEPVTLVMSDGRLRLRTTDSGVDVSWPEGFSAQPGSRIRIVDAQGVEVMTQGVQVSNARGVEAGGRIDICGIGAKIYR